MSGNQTNHDYSQPLCYHLGTEAQAAVFVVSITERSIGSDHKSPSKRPANSGDLLQLWWFAMICWLIFLGWCFTASAMLCLLHNRKPQSPLQTRESGHTSSSPGMHRSFPNFSVPTNRSATKKQHGLLWHEDCSCTTIGDLRAMSMLNKGPLQLITCRISSQRQ